MDKNKHSDLSNPNDDSHGQCYAPEEKGRVNISKKIHIPEGGEIPKGWVEVECDCYLKNNPK